LQDRLRTKTASESWLFLFFLLLALTLPARDNNYLRAHIKDFARLGVARTSGISKGYSLQGRRDIPPRNEPSVLEGNDYGRDCSVV